MKRVKYMDYHPLQRQDNPIRATDTLARPNQYSGISVWPPYTGYVAGRFVRRGVPEPGAIMHQVASGESAIGIAEKYFKEDASQWGRDLRFYVNSLVYVNYGEGDSTKGIYRGAGNANWAATQVKSGYEVDYARDELKNNIIMIDETLKNDAADLKATFLEIGRSYQSMYPPRGGLTDFFVWRDDFEERRKANQPLDQIKENLKNIFN
jgi:hypothetical protein